MSNIRIGIIILSVAGLAFVPVSAHAQEYKAVVDAAALIRPTEKAVARRGAAGKNLLKKTSKKPEISSREPLFKWPGNIAMPSNGSFVPFSSGNMTLDEEGLTRHIITAQFAPQNIPQETQILKALQAEEAFYENQVRSAEGLRRLLEENINGLSAERVYEVSNVISKLDSPLLKEILLKSLRSDDVYTLYKDLMDYYTFGGDAARAASDFLKRHPHKPTLMLRRLLRHPLVDVELKKQVAGFLRQSNLSNDDLKTVRTLVTQMQANYLGHAQQIEASSNIQAYVNFCRDIRNRLRAVQLNTGSNPEFGNDEQRELLNDLSSIFSLAPQLDVSPLREEVADLRSIWISAERNYYLNVTDRLLAFREKFGHNPRWYTSDEEEYRFFEEIDHLLKGQGPRSFVDLPQERQALQKVWNRSSYGVASLENTLQRLDEFVRTHPGMYPRRSTQEVQVPPEENHLFEDLLYWRATGGADVEQAVRSLLDRYLTP